MSRSEMLDVLRGVLEEQAVALGGLVAVHEVDDDFVWRLFRSLDGIRERAFASLTGGSPTDEPLPSTAPRTRPHPAIEEYLARLRRA